MRLALTLHPDSACEAVSAITVEVARPGPGALILRYLVTGRIAALRLPPPAAPARTDELWRHSCLEAFVRGPEGEAYYELNFAPSTRWAAYRFDGYRSGMTAELEIPQPPMEARADAASFALQVSLDLSGSAGLPADGPWRLGLSAVIEDQAGGLSYWALAHPPGRPDFHHPDCFAGELMAPERS